MFLVKLYEIEEETSSARPAIYYAGCIEGICSLTQILNLCNSNRIFCLDYILIEIDADCALVSPN